MCFGRCARQEHSANTAVCYTCRLASCMQLSCDPSDLFDAIKAFSFWLCAAVRTFEHRVILKFSNSDAEFAFVRLCSHLLSHRLRTSKLEVLSHADDRFDRASSIHSSPPRSLATCSYIRCFDDSLGWSFDDGQFQMREGDWRCNSGF